MILASVVNASSRRRRGLLHIVHTVTTGFDAERAQPLQPTRLRLYWSVHEPQSTGVTRNLAAPARPPNAFFVQFTATNLQILSVSPTYTCPNFHCNGQTVFLYLFGLELGSPCRTLPTPLLRHCLPVGCWVLCRRLRRSIEVFDAVQFTFEVHLLCGHVSRLVRSPSSPRVSQLLSSDEEDVLDAGVLVSWCLLVGSASLEVASGAVVFHVEYAAVVRAGRPRVGWVQLDLAARSRVVRVPCTLTYIHVHTDT